jgi:hypothetical protein
MDLLGLLVLPCFDIMLLGGRPDGVRISDEESTGPRDDPSSDVEDVVGTLRLERRRRN